MLFFFFFAGALDRFLYIVTVVLVSSELGLEQPHHFGSTARSLRSSIPERETGSCMRTLRMKAKALDKPDYFSFPRNLWGPRAELFKGENLA